MWEKRTLLPLSAKVMAFPAEESIALLSLALDSHNPTGDRNVSHSDSSPDSSWGLLSPSFLPYGMYFSRNLDFGWMIKEIIYLKRS